MTAALVGTVIALYGAWETPNRLGNTHQAQARYDEAENAYRRALQIIQPLHGRDVAYAVVANNLGAVLQRRGRVDEAEQMYRAAIEAWNDAPALFAAHQALAYANAGSLAMNRGRLDESAALLEVAARAQSRLREPALAHTLITRANLELLRGDAGRAAEHLAAARLTQQQFGGTPDMQIAWATTQCGVLAARGLFAEAAEACRGARSSVKALYGDAHPQMALLELRTGQVLMARGDFEEAAASYRHAASIYARTLGEKSLAYGRSLVGMAAARRSQRQFPNALALARTAEEIFAIHGGAALPDRITVLQLAADVHRLLGHASEAEPICRQALALAEQSSGPDSALVSDLLNTLAVVLYSQPGGSVEGGPLLERSLAIREAKLGKTHPNLAELLSNLAYVRLSQGRPADAAPLFERSLALRQQATGTYHPTQLPSLEGYVASLELLGRKDDARWARSVVRRVAAETEPGDPSAHILTFAEWKSQNR